MTKRLLLAPLFALALLTAACGGDSDTDSSTTTEASSAGSGGATVVATGLKFKPAKVEIATGDTVTWKFDDGSIQHNVKGDGFKSETVADGEFEHTFDEPGSYEYACTLHPAMEGTVEVG